MDLHGCEVLMINLNNTYIKKGQKMSMYLCERLT